MAKERKRASTEIQEQIADELKRVERVRLGPKTSHEIENDPKHLSFVLARYKFVAKMLDGFDSALEIGCGDGFGTALVAQSVRRVLATDVESYGFEDVPATRWHRERIEYRVHDMVAGPTEGEETFSAAYSIDVIEHIEPESEGAFLTHAVRSLVPDGVMIVGTPNAAAAAHASSQSRHLHINLKTHESLRDVMSRHFEHVFMFGMNDEVLHTGFGPMCHYLFALAVRPRAG